MLCDTQRGLRRSIQQIWCLTQGSSGRPCASLGGASGLAGATSTSIAASVSMWEGAELHRKLGSFLKL